MWGRRLDSHQHDPVYKTGAFLGRATSAKQECKDSNPVRSFGGRLLPRSTLLLERVSDGSRTRTSCFQFQGAYHVHHRHHSLPVRDTIELLSGSSARSDLSLNAPCSSVSTSSRDCATHVASTLFGQLECAKRRGVEDWSSTTPNFCS